MNLSFYYAVIKRTLNNGMKLISNKNDVKRISDEYNLETVVDYSLVNVINCKLCVARGDKMLRERVGSKRKY